MLRWIFVSCFLFLMDIPNISRLSRRCVLFLIYGLLAMSLADLSTRTEDDDSLSDEDEIFIKPDIKKNDTPKENYTVLLAKYHRECMNLTDVRETLVEKLEKGYWGIVNRDLMEWAFCVLIKLGIMSEQAVFRVDVAMSRISECDKKRAEMIIDKCLTNKERPPLETAWQYLKCLSIKDPKRNLSLGIFPKQLTKQ